MYKIATVGEKVNSGTYSLGFWAVFRAVTDNGNEVMLHAIHQFGDSTTLMKATVACQPAIGPAVDELMATLADEYQARA